MPARVAIRSMPRSANETPSDEQRLGRLEHGGLDRGALGRRRLLAPVRGGHRGQPTAAIRGLTAVKRVPQAAVRHCRARRRSGCAWLCSCAGFAYASATVGGSSVLVEVRYLFPTTAPPPHASSPLRRPSRRPRSFCAPARSACGARRTARRVLLFAARRAAARERRHGLEADRRHRRAAARFLHASRCSSAPASITRGCSSAGTRCTRSGSASEADRWLGAAPRPASRRSSASATRAPNRRELPSHGALHARRSSAFHERYPWVKTFATWNEANHCGEPTCQPSRRSSPPTGARSARLPELPRPRGRAARRAEHGRRGRARSAAPRASSRSSGACTTTSTPTASRPATRRDAEGDHAVSCG